MTYQVTIYNCCNATWFSNSYIYNLPESVESWVTLQAKDWRRQGGADQNELEDGVDLADGGRLDLGGGQGHVEVLLNAELQCRFRWVEVNANHCHNTIT